MSEKILYSLSDDKQDLHKQIGCMNGFLHLFDRNHFINRRLPPGENSHQGRDAYGSSKISKAKHQKKVGKGLQKNDVESSRASFSSSTGSTALSSLEYEETTKSEQSLFGESNITETFSQNGRANQPQSSPYRSNSSPNMDHQFHKSHVRNMINACASSPIRTTKGEQVVRYIKSHVNSPRLLESSKFESPRLAALNESFGSISSNQSAPVTPLKQKDSPRLSYDGTETRATFISSLKFGDLPRLSLDSRQRTMNKTSSELKRDSLLRDLQTEKYNTSRIENLREEPGSYSPPSNVVAKLMGLEALPDCTLTKKSQTEPDGSICGRLDSLSASSRTIDESKVNRVLDSPRYNSKDSRTSRLNKAELPTKPKSPARSSIEKVPKKQQDEHPDSERRASKHEVECQNHCLTLYGEIEKRLADLDFKKSGKDLRALKQILDAIHREKTMKEIERENQPSGFAPQTSSGDSGYISQTQGPQKASQKHQEAIYLIPHTGKGSKGPTDIKSTKVIKPAKLVRGSSKEIGPITHEVSLSRLNQVRVDQQQDSVQESVKKRTTKDQTSELQISEEPACQTHCTIQRDSGARTRPIQTSKVPQHMTNVKFTTSQKISDKVSIKTNGVCENHFHTPARTMCKGTTQNNQQAKGRRYQNRKLQQKPSILQDKADQSSSADSALLSQQGNAYSLISKINSLISHADTVISSTYQLSMKIDTRVP